MLCLKIIKETYWYYSPSVTTQPKAVILDHFYCKHLHDKPCAKNCMTESCVNKLGVFGIIQVVNMTNHLPSVIYISHMQSHLHKHIIILVTKEYYDFHPSHA